LGERGGSTCSERKNETKTQLVLLGNVWGEEYSSPKFDLRTRRGREGLVVGRKGSNPVKGKGHGNAKKVYCRRKVGMWGTTTLHSTGWRKKKRAQEGKSKRVTIRDWGSGKNRTISSLSEWKRAAGQVRFGENLAQRDEVTTEKKLAQNEWRRGGRDKKDPSFKPLYW